MAPTLWLLAAALAAPAADVEFFERKVRPVLAEKCYPCHNAKTLMGVLSLDTEAGVLKGGNRGTVIVAGDPTEAG